MNSCFDAPRRGVPPHTTADSVARRLLEALDLEAFDLPDLEAPHPDLDWAASGLAHSGFPAPAPAPVAACMRGALAALAHLAGHEADLSHVDPPALLGERAAHAPLRARGRTTAGGSGRLVRARDGWLAVQLPRPDDLAALPAWLECDPTALGPIDAQGPPPFSRIEAMVVHRDAGPLVEQARLLGLAVAKLPEPDDRSTPPVPGDAPAAAWVTRSGGGSTSHARRGRRRLRVLDLSTLWAGPLCGRLLAWCGADVVKVEHPGRVDGARHGVAPFFDALNGDKQALALDPTSDGGRHLLLDLIERADVVIESARPRALTQLGIDARTRVEAHPGLTWVSITGYGRTPPADAWVAFGDDAAAAAGLVGRDPAGRPVFCGDAIADPLTGAHAALAALAGAHLGGGVFDVPLTGVARAVRLTPVVEAPLDPSAESDAVMRPPRFATPRPARPAAKVGAHSAEVRKRWGAGTRTDRC